MNNLVSSVQGGLPILLVGFGVAGGGFGKIARFFYVIVNFFRVELIAVLVRRVTENNGDGYERNIVFFYVLGRDVHCAVGKKFYHNLLRNFGLAWYYTVAVKKTESKPNTF